MRQLHCRRVCHRVWLRHRCLVVAVEQVIASPCVSTGQLRWGGPTRGRRWSRRHCYTQASHKHVYTVKGLSMDATYKHNADDGCGDGGADGYDDSIAATATMMMMTTTANLLRANLLRGNSYMHGLNIPMPHARCIHSRSHWSGLIQPSVSVLHFFAGGSPNSSPGMLSSTLWLVS